MEARTSRSATLLLYGVGFALSIILTLAAYSVVVGHWLSGMALIVALLVLALAQFLVQMIFFLHLGQEPKPRLNLLLFGFMAGTLLILVIGSLWIMNHLNYHIKQGKELDTYIMNDEGVHH